MPTEVTVAPTLGHPLLMTQDGVGTTPGYDAIDLRRMIQGAAGAQEGVYDPTGWKVTENSGGPNMTVQVAAAVGLARIGGDSVAHQGPYIVAPHWGPITLDVPAAHATNPRVDLVALVVRDDTHDALGQNDVRAVYLPGTPASGATLDNLTGQPALPANAIRFADVHAPAADTTISNVQIRDRRPWAKGAYFIYKRPSNSGNYSTTSTINTPVDSANMLRRIEVSSGAVRCSLRGSLQTAVETQLFDLFVDGAAHLDTRSHVNPVVNYRNMIDITWEVPGLAPGSHTFEPVWRSGSAGNLILPSDTLFRPTWTIEERLVQSAANQ